MPFLTHPRTSSESTTSSESVGGAVDLRVRRSRHAELRRYRANDAPAVMDACRRLSPDSFHQRFFTKVPDRSTLVVPLLERIDHVDHEMFLAWIDSRVVGIAQWDRATTDPRSLEVALVVADPWQHQGIGRRLLGAVASDARRRGATELRAHIMTTNQRALNLARSIGPSHSEVDGPDVVVTFRRTDVADLADRTEVADLLEISENRTAPANELTPRARRVERRATAAAAEAAPTTNEGSVP